MVLPIIVLYYKLDDYKNALKYLKLIRGEGFDGFFLDEINDEDEDMYSMYGYRADTQEEVADAISGCLFLYASAKGVLEWIEGQIVKSLK